MLKGVISAEPAILVLFPMVKKSKIKHKPTIWSIYFPPRYLPKRKKQSISPYKHLYMNMYINFLCNSPTLETTQMSINRWMGSEVRDIYLFSRTELNNEKNGFLKCTITWMHLKVILPRESGQRVHTVRFNLYKILENSEQSIGKESRWVFARR